MQSDWVHCESVENICIESLLCKGLFVTKTLTLSRNSLSPGDPTVTVPHCALGALAFVLPQPSVDCCSLPHLCSSVTSPWAAAAVFAPCSCAAFLLAAHLPTQYWGMTGLLGRDHYQQETCLSLPIPFILTVDCSSWFTAWDPMIHMCKEYKLAAVQHLPLINMCSSQCKQHHKQEQPVGSLIRSWWKQGSYCGRRIGGRQPAALARMPRVGCSSPPPQLATGERFNFPFFFVLLYFFHQITLTIRVIVCH